MARAVRTSGLGSAPTGLSYSDAKSALTAEYKKTGDLDQFLAKVATHVEEIIGTSVQIVVG